VADRGRTSDTPGSDDLAGCGGAQGAQELANDTGLSQHALIAEGLNYVLNKYGRPSVAT